jgi:translation elongation factor EF-1alpha
MAEGKQHVSIVICGHVDAGKSTTTGRLIFELGGIPEREMQKLKDEAQKLGKGSFAFAFYMDRQKDERERGVTIACTTKVRHHFTNRSSALRSCTQTRASWIWFVLKLCFPILNMLISWARSVLYRFF